MPILSVIFSPEAVGKLHDSLVCLSKFSESVSIEARKDKLIFSTINSSKSAHACFIFDSRQFCAKYAFSPSGRTARRIEADGGRFTCQLYNKALLSVFKGRLLDVRDKDTAIERCELSIQDRPDSAECRILVRMICRHGVVKTYKLTYESTEVMHALFDKNAAPNRWKMSARLLREFAEHFGPKTEQLDIYTDNGRATFTSYTEKIMDGKEILKQPLQTSVAIDTLEFEEFVVEEKLHIAISVRDFKAVVAHGDTLNATVSALYSQPTRPMQLSYEGGGLLCEYTLMTIGEASGGAASQVHIAEKPTSKAPHTPLRPVETQSDEGTASRAMRPPEGPIIRPFRSEAGNQRDTRPPPATPKASIDSQSLFLPEGDDDSRWDAHESGNEEEEDVLGWDARVDFEPRPLGLGSRATLEKEWTGNEPEARTDDQRIAPTQRISQIRGIFDD